MTTRTKEDLELRKLELETERLELQNGRLVTGRAIDEISLRRAREKFALRSAAYRKFHFQDAVYDGSVTQCLSVIASLLTIDPIAPIEIIFDSPGGSVFAGLELHDSILAYRAAGAKIDTSILGMAASMAGVLAQAGETRRMGPHAYFMVHEVGSISVGKLSTMKDATKFAERLYERTLGILAERSTLSVDEIRERAERRDWWMDSQEALDLGFIDEITSSPSVSSR